MGGWIKIFRDLATNDIWLEKPFSRGQAWVDLLLMANYEPRKFAHGNEIVDLRAGEFITSTLGLAERWGWSRHKVTAFLDLLENLQMISQKRTTKKTVIFVEKWGFFQGEELPAGQQKDNKRTTKGQQKDTYKNKRNKEKKKNNICAFEREYDFDAIERDLLKEV